jgi:hypothetical protein
VIVAAPKPARAVACKWSVRIGGTDYAVTPWLYGVTRCWRLDKADGTHHEVSLGAFGPACTCPAATYQARPCKHVRALARLGCLPVTPDGGAHL